MRTTAARYAAWCRRRGTMQCSPGVAGLADALADGTLDVVVTAHRGLFELDERDGARP